MVFSISIMFKKDTCRGHSFCFWNKTLGGSSWTVSMQRLLCNLNPLSGDKIWVKDPTSAGWISCVQVEGIQTSFSICLLHLQIPETLFHIQILPFSCYFSFLQVTFHRATKDLHQHLPSKAGSTHSFQRPVMFKDSVGLSGGEKWIE